MCEECYYQMPEVVGKQLDLGLPRVGWHHMVSMRTAGSVWYASGMQECREVPPFAR